VPARLYLGTSGFKFDDWAGAFYPPGLNEREWLTYYGTQFNALEVNASYYALFSPRTFFYMARKVPDDFQFTVKAFKSLTHDRTDNAQDFSAFRKSLDPLLEAQKFGCVVAQFPHSFHDTPANRQYLDHFIKQFEGLALVVEFRGREWATDEVLDFLRERQTGYICVDEPQLKSLMPPLAVATSPVGYVRFHGRNAKEWYAGDGKKRYDYLYTADELGEWAPRIERLWHDTSRLYIFMNNCYMGKATRNALQLREMLQGTLPLG